MSLYFTIYFIFGAILAYFVCFYIESNYYVQAPKIEDNKTFSEFSRDKSANPKRKPVKYFTMDELSYYDGSEKSKGLYLSILGKVYDVESGRQHYGPGGNYHYFAGRDASKSFVTGDTENLTDDVTDLSPLEVRQLKHWLEFYKKNYKFKGKLIGRYYNGDGTTTEHYKKVKSMVANAEQELRSSESDKLLYPPCNSEWSQDSGTRVWCSTMSGGIERDWVGVPRMLYEAGSESYRCACVKDSNKLPEGKMVKLYPSCDPSSESCKVYEN